MPPSITPTRQSIHQQLQERLALLQRQVDELSGKKPVIMDKEESSAPKKNLSLNDLRLKQKLAAKATANAKAVAEEKAAEKKAAKAAEKAAAEKAAAEKTAIKKAAAEKAAAEKAAAEKATAEKAAIKKAAAEKAAAEKAAAEKAAAEKAAAEKAAAKTAAAEKAAVEKAANAAAKKAAAEKAAAEKAAAKKAAAEKAAAEKAVKAAAKKAAAEKAAAEKAVKAAAKKAAAEKKATKSAEKLEARANRNNEKADERLRRRLQVNTGVTDTIVDESGTLFRSNFHNAFPDWASKTFEKFNREFDDTDDKVKLHQAIPSKFISSDTPFRGILLYHGLGSGKTRTAISIAETGGFKNVLVILPASLKTNFINELKLYNESVDINKYSFIHSNGLTHTGLNNFEKNHFDDKLIIIDEVHNITSGLKNPKSIKSKLYKKLTDAENSKFVLMSGTPMINHPVEISHIVNLLRGKQIVYSAVIPGNTDPASLASLRESLIENQHILTSELSKTDPDYIMKFTLTPPLFTKVNDGLLVKLKQPVVDKKKLKIITKSLGLGKVRSEINYALPINSDEFDKQFQDKESKDVFKRRIAGSISYYSQQSDNNNFAEISEHDVQLKLTDIQFDQYKEKRATEIKSEKSPILNSVYKVYSRAVCNFAFPETPKIDRLFPKDLRVFVNDVLDVDSAEHITYDPTSQKIDTKSQKQYNNKISESIERLSEYFDELEKDNKLIQTLESEMSPKFADIYNKIESEKGIGMVYSDFKNVEGIQIMKLILEKKNICELKIVKEGGVFRLDKRLRSNENCNTYFIHYGSSPDMEVNKILIQICNNELGELKKLPELFQDIKNKFEEVEDNIQVNGKIVKCVLLTKSGSEGISLKNIRSVFIVEPYWNDIRLKQVIGRAVRMNSHEALDERERNVKVFKYVSVFSDDQITQIEQRGNHPLLKDNGQTSDQLIREIAKQKTDQIERFQILLQEASIDCSIHKTSSDCLKMNPKKTSYENMFSFNIKSDAITVSIPVQKTPYGDNDDDRVLLVKFRHSEKDHEYLFTPTAPRTGILYKKQNEKRVFAGVMERLSDTEFKVSLKD